MLTSKKTKHVCDSSKCEKSVETRPWRTKFLTKRQSKCRLQAMLGESVFLLAWSLKGCIPGTGYSFVKKMNVKVSIASDVERNRAVFLCFASSQSVEIRPGFVILSENDSQSVDSK